MENNAWLILLAVISYLLGSLPTSYLVAQKIAGKDIRAEGSGNIGAMNTLRVLEAEKSAKLAVRGFGLVLIGDVGKAVLVIFLAKWLAFLQYDLRLALIISSFFVILGHNYSIAFKFKSGGRGIACLMGILLALDWRSFFVWGGTVLIAIFVAQHLLVRKINWKDFSGVFSVIGSQILGRVGGMIVALVPLYFLDSRLFFPTLAATVLVTIKHLERVKNYMAELGKSPKIVVDDETSGAKNNP